MPFRAIGIMVDGIENIAQLREENIQAQRRCSKTYAAGKMKRDIACRKPAIAGIKRFSGSRRDESVSARIHCH